MAPQLFQPHLQEDQGLWPASTASTGRFIPPRNWKLLHSGAGCLEWGSIPVSRFWVPYSRVILCEHASGNSDKVVCTKIPKKFTINFSPADLTIIGQYSKVSSGVVLRMQKVKGRSAGGLAHFTSGETWKIYWKETFRLNLSKQSWSQLQQVAAARFSAGRAGIHCTRWCGHLYQVTTGFESLDFPLHTHSDLSGL